MTAKWTVRDKDGHLLARFDSNSPREVGRKLVPSHFDAFRLEVSPSYREQFERAVSQVLQREGWHIVRRKAGRPSLSPKKNPPLAVAA